MVSLYFVFFSDISNVGDGWEATISCVSGALPGVPTALTATPSSVSREVVLSWTPPGVAGDGPVTGYQIESSPDGTATDSWSVLVADAGDTNTYTHTNLNNGQIIHYRVSAINGQGVGEASNVAQATVVTLPATTPGAPTNLMATSSGSTTTIVLSWTPPTDTGGATVTGYKIERSANGSTGWMEVVANTGNINAYSHTGLTDDETIHYRVFAINSEGQGATASSVAQATVGVEPITAPGAPTDLTATASGSTTTIVLSWTPPVDTGGDTITGYKIESSADGATGWMEVVADTGDANTYSHTGLADGETIHYRVFAINSEGAGAMASNVAFGNGRDGPDHGSRDSHESDGNPLRLFNNDRAQMDSTSRHRGNQHLRVQDRKFRRWVDRVDGSSLKHWPQHNDLLPYRFNRRRNHPLPSVCHQ